MPADGAPVGSVYARGVYEAAMQRLVEQDSRRRAVYLGVRLIENRDDDVALLWLFMLAQHPDLFVDGVNAGGELDKADLHYGRLCATFSTSMPLSERARQCVWTILSDKDKHGAWNLLVTAGNFRMDRRDLREDQTYRFSLPMDSYQSTMPAFFASLAGKFVSAQVTLYRLNTDALADDPASDSIQLPRMTIWMSDSGAAERERGRQVEGRELIKLVVPANFPCVRCSEIGIRVHLTHDYIMPAMTLRRHGEHFTPELTAHRSA